MDKLKILLVEDDIDLGDLLVEIITNAGHEVTWYARARLTPEGPILMQPRGKEELVDGSGFNIAFVDYRLKGSPINGPELTAELVKSQLPVIATSGLPYFNDEMIACGAKAGLMKHCFSLGFKDALKHARTI